MDLLTTSEVATLLRLSPAAVLRRWRARDIPGFRIDANVVRFDRSEIMAWLAERRGAAYSPPTRQLAVVVDREDH